jgi:Putative zinc-finger
VRCSLLALSSYIDAELDIEPAGELEAHLLACDRCQTAMGHLREESQRIGGLARVHVPDGAVHELFSQIGLIEEGDDLPVAPEYHERPASLEAPPWFGAERGKALPWAPRGRYSSPPAGEPRELIGGRSPNIAVADPPELFLWDEPADQVMTPPGSTPPSAHPVPDPEPEPELTPEPIPPNASGSEVYAAPQIEAAAAAPQPPEVGFSPPQPPQVHPGGTPTAFRRVRDALAVRLALWRGAGSHLDSGVEIVSGAGAPTWNQRAHPKAWSDSPPVVVAPVPPVMDRPAQPVVLPEREPELETHSGDMGVPAQEAQRDRAADPTLEAPVAAPDTATPELADVLGEVAMLAAPLGRVPAPASTGPPAATAPVDDATAIDEAPVVEEAAPLIDSARAVDEAPEPMHMPVMDEMPMSIDTPVANDISAAEIAAMDSPMSPDDFPEEPAPSSPGPIPGRHVRRLKVQKPDRRAWNPTQPVTGRHVLPIGGPAVAAADRDRRLWVFAAVTAAVLVLGLLIGKQVTQAPAPAASTHRPTATAPAVISPTSAPLPIATPAPVVTGPPAPAPQQLTGTKNLGTGSSGFTVADVRYGMHPHDFRLVFDLAFPNSVTGSPTTTVGYFGPTTLYVEFTGVDGTAPIKSMPPGQVVVSVVPLPMVRNTGRVIFKITLSHNAPFDAYYLSGARLIIDVT